MFPLDTIPFENRTGARLLFAKNSQQQVTGRHEVVFQRIPFVCGMLENTRSRFCEGYIDRRWHGFGGRLAKELRPDRGKIAVGRKLRKKIHVLSHESEQKVLGADRVASCF